MAMAVACLSVSTANAQHLSTENKFAQPLGKVLDEVSKSFGVRLKFNVDTTGLVVNYAPQRIRQYSIDETLLNILAPFDFVPVKQNDKLYKIKSYEYSRRTDEDGERLIAYLQKHYSNKEEFDKRREQLRAEVRQHLGIDSVMGKFVQKPNVILSKVRKYDGYSAQNIALETLPGLYVCGTVYAPSTKGKHALIICPNGHFGNGRYRKDQQQRMGVLARMGAVCVDFDLFGWGESELQVGKSHQSSIAHVLQNANAIALLNYMLASRKDIDAKRIGVNGGSGGGTQTVMLTVLDDRFTAAAPVVSLSAHFDGGCPCESGLPVMTSAGGTCNAELAAAFAPKPLLVVSDGKDWTSTVPETELPYIKKVYSFYDAADNVYGTHLPTEGHDFGPNKRQPVYDFFAKVFSLDASKMDESKVTIEPFENMYSFGKNGEKLPANAVRSVAEITKYFDKQLYFDLRWMAGLDKKAKDWAESLQLNDAEKTAKVEKLIATHLKRVTEWHNSHPYTTVPAGINPRTGETLRNVDREIIADAAQPKHYHTDLMEGLRAILTEQQVEQILDKYTVGKVAFTLKGYKAIVPDMTAEEEAECLRLLKEARERAIDFKSMKEISEIFGMYKDKCEDYFNTHGRNWKQMYSAYYKKLQSEKKKAKK